MDDEAFAEYIDANVVDTFPGWTIKRLSGLPGTSIPGVSGGIWGTDVHHQYSTRAVWNADQSIIYIDNNSGGSGTGAVFLDAKTFAPLYGIIRPGADFFWHPTDKTKMIYANGAEIGYYFPATQTKTAVNTFTGYTNLGFGPFKRGATLDGSMVGITGTNPSSQGVVFAYNINTNTQHPDIILANYDVPHGGIVLGDAGISPLGTYIQMSNSTNDLTVVTDLAGTVVTTTTAGIPSHYDMAVDNHGDEVMVGKDVSGGVNSGKIVKVRMSDGAVTVLTPGTYGRHTSTRCTANAIYAVSSTEPKTSSAQLYDSEVLIYRLDTIKVLSLGSDLDNQIDFESEAIPSVRNDAQQIVFASNHGDPTGRPMAVYLISGYLPP